MGRCLAAEGARDRDDLLEDGVPPGVSGSLPEEATALEKFVRPGGQGGWDLETLD